MYYHIDEQDGQILGKHDCTTQALRKNVLSTYCVPGIFGSKHTRILFLLKLTDLAL